MKDLTLRKTNLLKWTIWILAATFYFYEFVLRVSPSVIVSELMQSFKITAYSVGILSAFYLYAYAPMQLPVGLLTDRYGVKKTLSIAFIICGTGSILFSLGHHFYVACAGRFLIGIGSSFAFIIMIYISAHWFSSKKRAFLIGLANSLAMLGASIGAGGPLASVIHKIGWNATFALFGIFGIALGFLVYFIFSLDKHDIEVEKKTDHHKIHILKTLKQICSQKTIWIISFAALFFYITTTAFGGLWGVSFIQKAYRVNKDVAGYAISMIFAGWLVGGPLTGFLSDLFATRNTTIRIGIIGTLLCLTPIIYFTSMPIYVVYILLFLVGLFSSAELLSFTMAIETNKLQGKAIAAAFVNFIISCGDAIVQPLIGFILDNSWKGVIENGIRSYQISTYQIALTCLPIALIVAFFLLFFVKEKKHQ